jgi:Ubiquitin elongating factor core
MHLNLTSIKVEKFRVAESQLESLKLLLDYKEAQQAFVKSLNFLLPGLNGKQIQMETYLGRYLSFSCLSHETKTFKDTYFKGMSKSSLSGINRMVDGVAEQIHNFHKNLHEVIAKLIKNKDCKERMMEWFRLAVGLNQEKQKMFT